MLGQKLDPISCCCFSVPFNPLYIPAAKLCLSQLPSKGTRDNHRAEKVYSGHRFRHWPCSLGPVATWQVGTMWLRRSTWVIAVGHGVLVCKFFVGICLDLFGGLKEGDNWIIVFSFVRNFQLSSRNVWTLAILVDLQW